jgi:hypothetical protein
MNSPPILEEIHVINTYDGSSFIKEDHSRRIHPNDPTRVAVFPAETDRGTKFEPFPLETRSFRINILAYARFLFVTTGIAGTSIIVEIR